MEIGKVPLADARPSLTAQRSRLLSLLASLDDAQWAAPTAAPQRRRPRSERRPAEPQGALVAYVRSLRSCEPEALATVYSYEPEALAATPRLSVLLEVPQLDTCVTRFFVPQ
jgi:hypothetical protein